MQPVAVTNTGTLTINGWTVTSDIPAGHTILNYWNWALTVNRQIATAKNEPTNGTIGASGNQQFEFEVHRPTDNIRCSRLMRHVSLWWCDRRR